MAGLICISSRTYQDVTANDPQTVLDENGQPLGELPGRIYRITAINREKNAFTMNVVRSDDLASTHTISWTGGVSNSAVKNRTPEFDTSGPVLRIKLVSEVHQPSQVDVLLERIV